MKTRIVLLLILVVAVSASAQTYPDKFTVTVDGSGFYISHVNAYYDCQSNGFMYDVSHGEKYIYVQEHEQPAGGLSECNCYYDLDVYIAQAPPGEWDVTVFWLDETYGDWDMRIFPVVIPDLGQGDELDPGPVTQSGCYPGTIGNQMQDWGNLKTLYR
jgi:hypothetical protein